MIRLQLTSTQCAELQQLRREPPVKPAERDRVEMVLLSAAGWSVPQIAQHLKYCAATVRRVFVQFQSRGPAGLRHQRPGPPPDQARRAQVERELTRLWEQERTWTTRQLAAALGKAGITLSPRQVRRYLHALRARYGRTARSQRQRQDPDRLVAGQLRLASLDECGFSPSLPVTWSWHLPGRRKFIPYENPPRRRLNAIAALVHDQAETTLWWGTAPRSLTAHDLLHVVRTLPHGDKPLLVVLDNASIHTSRVVREARPELEAAGIFLDYLPSYSSELNEIEPYFGVIKYYDLPERTYPSLTALQEAVEAAFARTEARLISKPRPLPTIRQQLRPAA
jgi:putative transposase